MDVSRRNAFTFKRQNPQLPETHTKGGYFSRITRSLEAAAGTAPAVEPPRTQTLLILLCHRQHAGFFYLHSHKIAATAPGIRPNFRAKGWGEAILAGSPPPLWPVFIRKQELSRSFHSQLPFMSLWLKVSDMATLHYERGWLGRGQRTGAGLVSNDAFYS